MPELLALALPPIPRASDLSRHLHFLGSSVWGPWRPSALRGEAALGDAGNWLGLAAGPCGSQSSAVRAGRGPRGARASSYLGGKRSSPLAWSFLGVSVFGLTQEHVGGDVCPRCPRELFQLFVCWEVSTWPPRHPTSGSLLLRARQFVRGPGGGGRVCSPGTILASASHSVCLW